MIESLGENRGGGRLAELGIAALPWQIESHELPDGGGRVARLRLSGVEIEIPAPAGAEVDLAGLEAAAIARAILTLQATREELRGLLESRGGERKTEARPSALVLPVPGAGSGLILPPGVGR